MIKRVFLGQGADGNVHVMSQDEAAEAWTPMSRDECEAAFDRLVNATNHVGGGGIEGYKWAVGQLLRQMLADHGSRSVAVMRELGWQPARGRSDG